MVKIDSRRNDSSDEDEDGAMCRPRHRKQETREGSLRIRIVRFSFI